VSHFRKLLPSFSVLLLVALFNSSSAQAQGPAQATTTLGFVASPNDQVQGHLQKVEFKLIPISVINPDGSITIRWEVERVLTSVGLYNMNPRWATYTYLDLATGQWVTFQMYVGHEVTVAVDFNQDYQMDFFVFTNGIWQYRAMYQFRIAGLPPNLV
jgi:hypothetical protein